MVLVTGADEPFLDQEGAGLAERAYAEEGAPCVREEGVQGVLKEDEHAGDIVRDQEGRAGPDHAGLPGEAEEDAAARCQDEGEEGGYQEAGTPQTQSSVRARSGKAK